MPPHDTDNPTTATPETEPPTSASAETPAAKRERNIRDMPPRVFRRDGERWECLPLTFAGITEAEAWIRKSGADAQTYWPLKGPAEASLVEPRRVVSVAVDKA